MDKKKGEEFLPLTVREAIWSSKTLIADSGTCPLNACNLSLRLVIVVVVYICLQKFGNKALLNPSVSALAPQTACARLHPVLEEPRMACLR